MRPLAPLGPRNFCATQQMLMIRLSLHLEGLKDFLKQLSNPAGKWLVADRPSELGTTPLLGALPYVKLRQIALLEFLARPAGFCPRYRRKDESVSYGALCPNVLRFPRLPFNFSSQFMNRNANDLGVVNASSPNRLKEVLMSNGFPFG